MPKCSIQSEIACIAKTCKPSARSPDHGPVIDHSRVVKFAVSWRRQKERQAERLVFGVVYGKADARRIYAIRRLVLKTRALTRGANTPEALIFPRKALRNQEFLIVPDVHWRVYLRSTRR